MSKREKDQTSFIEEARRKQIVAGAVITIARRGMAYTTLEDIADEINISKGAISYYFSSKTQLISEVFDFLLNEQRAHRKNRVEQKSAPVEKLREFVRADMDYYRNHRDNLICWTELYGYYSSPGEKILFEHRLYDHPHQVLVDLIRDGQAGGTYSMSLDAGLYATLIEAAIEGVMMQWVFNPSQVDLQQCGEEIIRVFENTILKQG
jgi:TetR/AcrR family fatty acid metabolism transcriptional regulator